MGKPVSRRAVLRGLGGVTIALPFLEAMVPGSAFAAPAAGKIPSRMGVFYFGTGMNIPDFLPTDFGKECTFGPILKPLEPFRGEMTVLSGTYLEHGGGHDGDYPFLTGTAVRKADGSVVSAVSADQVVASQIGSQTRFPSLQLSISRGTGYGGRLSTLAWNKDGTPLVAEDDPHLIFNRLFRADNAAEKSARDRTFRRRGSILDAIEEQAKQLQPRVSGADRAKLDEYFTSIREVEGQLQRNLSWSEKSKPSPDTSGLGNFGQPYAPNSPVEGGWRYETYAKMMYDLIALAFQTDSTRVLTYVVRKEAQGGIYAEFGISKDYHALTHHNNNPSDLADLTRVDTIYMRHWAYFLQRLQSMKEPDGSSLLDYTMLAFSSGMGFNHSRNRLPTAIFGGSACGISHQGHLKLPDNTPLAGLWHTMVDRMGVTTGPNFQDSRGTIKELVA